MSNCVSHVCGNHYQHMLCNKLSMSMLGIEHMYRHACMCVCTCSTYTSMGFICTPQILIYIKALHNMIDGWWKSRLIFWPSLLHKEIFGKLDHISGAWHLNLEFGILAHAKVDKVWILKYASIPPLCVRNASSAF